MSFLDAIWLAVERLLRGPRASRILTRSGIDTRRFWLLMDLFHTISDRGEMTDQLGRASIALEYIAWMYFALTALMALLFTLIHPPVANFFLTFQFFSAFLLFNILVSEAGNSLINPIEAMVLAHQPINGATYTAAKVSHLFRIVLYLVPGLNAVPAFAGLTAHGARWSYPILHFASAFAIGIAASLLCCSLFGWLLRFVPAKRLKAAGQFAGAVPLMGMFFLGRIQQFVEHLHLGRWLPADPAARSALAIAAVAAALVAALLGIRSLSADYLLRVSTMVRGGSAAGAKARRSRLAMAAARLFGGPPAHGGFAFVSHMMLRDWQFRRQIVPMLLPMVFGFGGSVAEGWRKDPFAAGFSTMHLLPHFLGMFLFFVCNILVYGSDYKGAWVFQLVPSHAIEGFAGGVFALLWMDLIVIPHLMLTLALIWVWGLWHALLYLAYSMAAASIYLALELRMIDGAPFSKQIDPSRSASSFVVMMAGAVAMAIAVGLQYFLLFRWPALLAAVTVVLGAVAYFLARRSIAVFAVAIRHNLGIESGEAGKLYTEIAV